jgi:serine/threonine-protein kinase
MAPERIRGLPEIDGRSDLFSVGVLLYELLTGTCPFAAPSAAASLAAVLEQVVDPDPRIEPRVWLEVQRALSKHAYERHPSARAMGEALRGAAGATEADLEAWLREAPLLRPTGEPASVRLLPVRGMATLARTVHIRGKALYGLRAWPSLALLAGVLAALLALALGEHARGSSSREAPSAKYAPAVSLTASSPTPPSGDVAADVDQSIPTLSSSAAAPPAPRHPPRSPARRPRPVATTPGF